MFADRTVLLAAVLVGVWAALATVAVARRRRHLPAGVAGLAALLFAGYASLADHVDDRGLGPTALDTVVWADAVGHRSTAATAVAAALRVGGGIAALALLAAVLAGALVARGRPVEAALVATAPVVSTLMVTAAKPGYGRPRPPAPDQLIPETGFSLPSGHTVDATVVIGVLALVLVRLTRGPLRAALATAAAAAVGASGVARLYLGVHWATDVLAGWLLGGAWIALCGALLLVLDTRGGDRARPPTPQPTVPEWNRSPAAGYPPPPDPVDLRQVSAHGHGPPTGPRRARVLQGRDGRRPGDPRPRPAVRPRRRPAGRAAGPAGGRLPRRAPAARAGRPGRRPRPQQLRLPLRGRDGPRRRER
jgi:undecaprenyl-diphosphatase